MEQLMDILQGILDSERDHEDIEQPGAKGKSNILS